MNDHARATESASRSWQDSLIKWAGSIYILDTVTRGRREMKLLAYLSQPAIDKN